MAQLALGRYNSTRPTVQDTKTSELQVDSEGRLLTSTTATISGDVNVDTSTADSFGLVGKASGGDFTTAYASATTITVGSLPSYHSTFIASDIVSIVQVSSAGAVLNTYTRDDATMAVSGSTITVTGATFGATDTFVIYTNIARAVSTGASVIPTATTMQSVATANGNGTALNVSGYTTAVLSIVSSPSMGGGTTVNFEATVDDINWSSILAHQIGSPGSFATSTTADGDFRINVSGYKSVRARISGYSSGTVTVKGYASPMSGHSTTVGLGTKLDSTNDGVNTIFATHLNTNTSAYAASLVVSAAAARAIEIAGYNSKGSAQWIQVHDAASLPADTAVPEDIIYVAATTPFTISYPENKSFSTGIVVCNSSTGPTKTIGSADCWITASYRT